MHRMMAVRRADITLIALHRTTPLVGWLPTIGSYGKLLVYECEVSGLVAAEAHAVHAKNAVSWRSSVPSVMVFLARPPFTAGSLKYVVQYSTCASNASMLPARNRKISVAGSYPLVLNCEATAPSTADLSTSPKLVYAV
jgi:hypothetical protein